MEEFDLIVIGAGPGGYVAAIKAAQLGLKTACIDSRGRLGGTCLNVGCIPSKSLLQDTHYIHQIQHDIAKRGIIVENLTVDLTKLMKHKSDVVEGLTSGIDLLFRKNKVTRIDGCATFRDEHILDVQLNSGESMEVKGKNIMIATGSEPSSVPGLEMDGQNIVSSTEALSFDDVPTKFVVVGGGVIGLELGSVWARLGAEVTVVEYLDTILPNLDADIRKAVQKSLEAQGISFKLGTKVTSATSSATGVELNLEARDGGEAQKMTASKVLVATGRRPNTDNLGLENIGIELDKHGFITVNDSFQTKYGHIYAIGDVIGGAMLAHKAEEEGIAAVEIIKGQKPHLNYAAIPSVVYTWPEVASVGFTKEEAIEAGLEVSVGQFPFMANSRARAIDDTEGFVKVLADKKTNRLIGCHIFGANAGDLIQEAVLVMEKAGKADDIAHLCHPHPGLGEAVKEAAMATIGKPIHM
ncbi:MAG: dihydrolipoyl dehydrogenase [Alphaproteobacteria bacterium]